MSVSEQIDYGVQFMLEGVEEHSTLYRERPPKRPVIRYAALSGAGGLLTRTDRATRSTDH